MSWSTDRVTLVAMAVAVYAAEQGRPPRQPDVATVCDRIGGTHPGPADRDEALAIARWLYSGFTD